MPTENARFTGVSRTGSGATCGRYEARKLGNSSHQNRFHPSMRRAAYDKKCLIFPGVEETTKLKRRQESQDVDTGRLKVSRVHDLASRKRGENGANMRRVLVEAAMSGHPGLFGKEVRSVAWIGIEFVMIGAEVFNRLPFHQKEVIIDARSGRTRAAELLRERKRRFAFVPSLR
uniref:Uncharacterized protein n=1 Tax=Branchiostoma floridae TaxID=7739 RepID=C3YU60_BRAFL|eukprot:XP_002600325.1 hypothetical protein BRAFLDRAFT_66827 [Branchiostoma floridae]